MVTRAIVGHLRSYPYAIDTFLFRGNFSEATCFEATVSRQLVLRQLDHGHKDLLRRPILDDHVPKATGEAYPKSGV